MIAKARVVDAGPDCVAVKTLVTGFVAGKTIPEVIQMLETLRDRKPIQRADVRERCDKLINNISREKLVHGSTPKNLGKQPFVPPKTVEKSQEEKLWEAINGIPSAPSGPSLRIPVEAELRRNMNDYLALREITAMIPFPKNPVKKFPHAEGDVTLLVLGTTERMLNGAQINIGCQVDEQKPKGPWYISHLDPRTGNKAWMRAIVAVEGMLVRYYLNADGSPNIDEAGWYGVFRQGKLEKIGKDEYEALDEARRAGQE